ncbi:unnamed protein product [Linum trigynum]|uniref:Uncharacterized protein n=1 Tax=Linum trigynum TaxID=586398 RepID=A0AAV2DG72_9ROSI
MGSIAQAADDGSRPARDRQQEAEEEEEELEAGIEIWSYVFGFTRMAVVKCAVELGIADAIEAHKEDSPLTLAQLAMGLGCDPAHLSRIMRFLVHDRVFREEPAGGEDVGYSLTPLSRRLLARQDGKSMADLLLLESTPVMLAPWHYLSATVRSPPPGEKPKPPPFEQAHGKSLFEYTEANPGHSKLFDGAMSCIARSTLPAIIRGCPELMDGVGTVVDVGGGEGTAVSLLVKGFPSITKGINFDLPHVVSVAIESPGVEHVGGDMFDSVPKADAVFIMQVLHDWNDEDCIRILKKCREAIAGRVKGKLIIVEAVVHDNNNTDNKEGKDGNSRLEHVRLMLDMIMMAHTTLGKERTLKEWQLLLRQAGFTRVVVTPIEAVQSIIQAFP